MKLILAFAAATAVLSANLERKEASQFLTRNKRWANKYWECAECPWEQAKEYYRSIKEDYPDNDYEALKTCVHHYTYKYEEFDEDMEEYDHYETRIKPEVPDWDCKMGAIEIELDSYVKEGDGPDMSMVKF